ncbi:conserved hypothetical protein [Xenorhabdus bovienii str. oregonense]|uniref:DUF2591 domain-containing protein n=1 Tax=Xenorhabdus bovienii str. oregonense TaxID=1398202 RepID=A0A077P6R7_XENBV|nr:phage protein NinX family protein [Xenorhabdus bovienii]CDH06830.1 conserved hypothetical protein [Xenorhabdus bovienii str. oregonense]
MKIKTSELTGKALDWAVAKSIGLPAIVTPLTPFGNLIIEGMEEDYTPSTDWSQCGQLIEKHRVELNFNSVSKEWSAYIFNFEELESVIEDGDTPQIAICRAVVAARWGNEVDIPDELVEGV